MLPDDLAGIVQDPGGPWLAGIERDALADLAGRLAERSDQLAGDQPDSALSAAVAATRAYEAAFGDGPGVPTRVTMGYLGAIQRQLKLHIAAGRMGEVPRLTALMQAVGAQVKEAAHRRSTVVQRRVQASTDRYRRVREWAARRSAVAREAVDVPDRAAALRRRLTRLAEGAATGAAGVDGPSGDPGIGTPGLGQVPADVAVEFLVTAAGFDSPGPVERELAGRIADRLCRLAPGLRLAAGYLRAVDGVDLASYLDRYDAAAPRLWAVGVPPGCPEPVARACLLAVEALSPASSILVGMCGFLDPAAEIPLDLLLAPTGLLPEEVRELVDSGRGLGELVGDPAALGLLDRSGATVRIDRRVQAALRSGLGEDVPVYREGVALLVMAAFPEIDNHSGVHAADEPRATALAPHLAFLAGSLADHQPDLAALLFDRVARYRFSRKEFVEAEDAVARALAQLERTDRPDSPDAADALDLLARIRWELHDEEGYRAALDRSLALQETRFGGDGLGFAHALEGHAEALRRIGDLAGARAALERALRLREEHGAPDHLGTRERLAEVLTLSADQPGAIDAYRRVVAAIERRYGPDDPQLLDRLAPLAAALREHGDLPEARAVLERALDILAASFNPDHPHGWVGSGLLEVLTRLGDRPAVQALLDRLLDLYTPHINLHNRHLAPVLDSLADALVGHGEPAVAEAVLERVAATKAAEPSYGPKHPHTLASLHRLADLQREHGEWAAAVATLERLLAGTEQRYGERHEEVAAVLLDLGEARARGGDRTEGLLALQRAMMTMERLRGASDPQTASFAIDVAAVVWRIGDLARATILLEHAVGLAGRTFGETHEETARALRALVGVTRAAGDEDAARQAYGRLVAIVPDEPDPAAPTTLAEPGGPAGPRTLADLDALAADWVDQVSVADLPAAAAGLAELADELEAAGRPEQALRANAEAVRAERRHVEEMPDEVLLDPDAPWRPLATLLGHRTRLLRATGRRQEVELVNAELSALHGRLRAWMGRLDEERERRVVEAERRMAPLRRRSALRDRVTQGRSPVERRLHSIRNRMAGSVPAPQDTTRVRRLPPLDPGHIYRPALAERVASALDSSPVVTLVAADPAADPGTTSLALECAYGQADRYPLTWWVDAGGRLAVQHAFAGLAGRLDLAVHPPYHLDAAAEAVLAELGRRTGWLLVFADAAPCDLLDRAAGLGTGRILVTAADPVPATPGARVEVGPLDPSTAAGLLGGDGAALHLAERLGRAPAAVRLVAAAGLDPAGCLAHLDDVAGRLQTAGVPPQGPALAAALAVDQLAATSPAGRELLLLCAFLEPGAELPLDRLTAPAPLLPDALRAAVDADVGLGEPLAALGRLGLIGRDGATGRLHPAVREVVRRTLVPDQAVAWWERAALLVLAGLPYLSGRPEPMLDEAALLVPHAIRLVDDPAADPIPAVMLLDEAGRYLVTRGQAGAATALLERAQALRDRIYEEDQESEQARTHLVTLLQESGERTRAAGLLERRLADRVAGEDLPADSREYADALHEMAVLLDDGGDRVAAREVRERELAIRERVHGPDSLEVAGLLRELARSSPLDGTGRASARAALERAVLIYEARYGPHAVELTHPLSDLARLLIEQGDLWAARSAHERTLAAVEGSYGRENMRYAQVLEQLATVNFQLDDVERGRDALTQAVPVYERTGPQREADRIRHRLADLLVRTRDAAAVRALYGGLIADHRAGSDDGTRRVVGLLREYAEVAAAAGDPGTARSALEQAVDACERAYGPDASEVATAYGDLSALLWKLGDRRAARTAAEQAVTIDERSTDGTDAQLDRDLNRLGEQLRQLGDRTSARPVLERTLALRERMHGGNTIPVARTLADLGRLYGDSGDHATARAAQERSLAIHERALGPDSADTLAVVGQLAETLRALGELPAAHAAADRALAGLTRALGPGDPALTPVLQTLGGVQRQAGDLSGACASLERVVALTELADGPDHPAVARVLRHLADVLDEQGDGAARTAALDRAILIETFQQG
jgi:tetratricopeptide (TPR) repeat protein